MRNEPPGRRQISHPGGGLRLAVHHKKIPATPAAESSVALHRLRYEPAAGLGDVAQTGNSMSANPTRSRSSKV